MTWNCAAIDHGITIFPHGKIGPCCLVSADYLKPISTITDPARFRDLKTPTAPAACQACVAQEYQGNVSYRQQLNQLATTQPGLQFVDIRNSNHCNLKCRYCGPHFSSQWAQELNGSGITVQDIEQYKDILITDSLNWMYFTGGEPLINADHWQLLNELVDQGRSSKISLLYNTNLTTIKYKDIDIGDLWSKFKFIKLHCSIDAIGQPLSYIRSGADWNKIKSNLETLKSQNQNIKIDLTPVLSILNIWFIAELFDYAQQCNIPVDLIILTGPDYLALDVMPDALKPLAMTQVDQLKGRIPNAQLEQIKSLINNNTNQCLFPQTINHILLLDNKRNEKLFDLLPFSEVATDLVLRNNEYQ